MLPMKKHHIFLLLVCAFASQLHAQQPAPRIICGNELFSTWVKDKYPELKNAFDATFETAKNQRPIVDSRSPLKVKVVVHIVWKNPAENLHDSIIQDQIRILNEDFNRLNPDTGNLRPIFNDVAGNAGIEFELAQVQRILTTELFSLDLLGNDLLSELKSTTQGGSDAWDTNKYLNIWVCKIQPTTFLGIPIGQILGFAFPPNGLSNWPANSGAPSAQEDGVVIDYRVFGSNNPNPIENPAGGNNLEVRGRTPTHEVGHYFGLRHIWGDGGLLGPNECDQSDGVDDTPFANAQSEFDCDKSKNSCDVVETYYNLDMPDLVENYMDYSSESCMNMFTKGQVQIMRNVLAGPRSGLLEQSSVWQPQKTNWSLNLVPNPAVDNSALLLQMPNQADLYLRVVNAAGQTVQQRVLPDLQAGAQQITLDSSTWPAGIYWVEAVCAGQTGVVKLVKN